MSERDEEEEGPDGWRENRRLVSANFRTLFNASDKIIAKLEEHEDDDRQRFEAQMNALTALTTKASILGFLGGAIASLVSGLLLWKLTTP